MPSGDIGYTATVDYRSNRTLANPVKTSFTTQAFRLGDWLVEPAINRVSDNQQTHKLPPKLIKLLCYLAEYPLDMLSREQLLDEVWEREFVNDEVLSRSIAQLRQALGDDARQPTFIETIPRKGYRLLIKPVMHSQHARSGWQRYRTTLFVTLLVVLAVLIYLWLSSSEVLLPEGGSEMVDPARLATNFTSQPGIERSADISVNGEQVVYAKSKQDGSDIYVSAVEGGPHQLLIGGAGYKESPVFSPDQTQVAYLARSNQGCSIVLFSLASHQSNTLGDCWNGNGTALDWSHNGRWLAYSYAAPVGTGLALIDIDSRDIRILTYPENPEHADIKARFSPDDKHLSFSRGNSTTSELYWLELGGTHSARRLTFDAQLVNGHDWIAADRLVYASDKQAFQALWLLQLDTLEVSYLGARRARRPAYNMPTNLLIYEDWQYQANIWALDLASGNQPQPLIVSTRYDNQPVFSPDDQQLAFGSNRTGIESIWLANADGSQARQAYSVSGARVSRPVWSPDGQRLISSVYGERGSQLHELTADGEFIRVIEWAGEHASNAVYLPDGQRLLYINESPETSQLWEASLIDGQQTSRRVGTVLANRVQVSRSGQVLFTRPVADGIVSLQVDSQQQKMIVSDYRVANGFHWLVVNESVVYANPNGVWKISINGGEPELLTEFIPTSIGTTLAMSSDEQTLLVSRTDAAEIDLMLSQLTFADDR